MCVNLSYGFEVAAQQEPSGDASAATTFTVVEGFCLVHVIARSCSLTHTYVEHVNSLDCIDAWFALFATLSTSVMFQTRLACCTAALDPQKFSLTSMTSLSCVYAARTFLGCQEDATRILRQDPHLVVRFGISLLFPLIFFL